MTSMHGVAPEQKLPDGYHFNGDENINVGEIVDLKRSASWNISTPKQLLSDSRYYAAGISILSVGVRTETDVLVGIGRLFHKYENGEFCDFVVDPRHRGQGIGKAIIDERLRWAETHGIPSLYILPLDPTNNLQSYYEQRGFRFTQAGELIRGPSPASVTALSVPGNSVAAM